MAQPPSKDQLTPESALACIIATTCPKTRRQFAIIYGQRWGREDINAAWSAVARSALQSTEKQLIYNELWG